VPPARLRISSARRLRARPATGAVAPPRTDPNAPGQLRDGQERHDAPRASTRWRSRRIRTTADVVRNTRMGHHDRVRALVACTRRPEGMSHLLADRRTLSGGRATRCVERPGSSASCPAATARLRRHRSRASRDASCGSRRARERRRRAPVPRPTRLSNAPRPATRRLSGRQSMRGGGGVMSGSMVPNGPMLTNQNSTPSGPPISGPYAVPPRTQRTSPSR
jgi:hypothetical protein